MNDEEQRTCHQIYLLHEMSNIRRPHVLKISNRVRLFSSSVPQPQV
jgi:hypothetical protein